MAAKPVRLGAVAGPFFQKRDLETQQTNTAKPRGSNTQRRLEGVLCRKVGPTRNRAATKGPHVPCIGDMLRGTPSWNSPHESHPKTALKACIRGDGCEVWGFRQNRAANWGLRFALLHAIQRGPYLVVVEPLRIYSFMILPSA